ncbi:MAG: LSU ribosomal protein L32P [Candidatus Nitrotoga sp. SPKER]|nr:MAG: LSU ribosomal protein L32P [Candidatus Nitrotoga sp. SPKER]
MAAGQNKKSSSKQGKRRGHDFMENIALAIETTTGEYHLRHHISPFGVYKGKKVAKSRVIGSFNNMNLLCNQLK